MTAFMVIGLGFGDEGKGTTIDALSKKFGAHTVVRFNGGAQAAHNVVHDDGTHHTFRQFGAATLRGVRTHLSREVLFNPHELNREVEMLKAKGVEDPMSMFTVHKDALVTTPYHMFLNAIREEARGLDRHGSCAMGIGETMNAHLTRPEATIRAADIMSVTVDDKTLVQPDLHSKLVLQYVYVNDELYHITKAVTNKELQTRLRERAEEFMTDEVFQKILFNITNFDANIVVDTEFEERLLKMPGNILLEGAQGVLLDEWYGFHPHTTWSTTTFHNAEKFLARYEGPIVKIGVTRAYHTRHGDGPFPSFDEAMTKKLPDAENVHNSWQGSFKAGPLDLTLLQYAVDMVQPDLLAVTCLDRLPDAVSLAKHHTSIRRSRRKTLEESEVLTTLLKQRNLQNDEVFVEKIHVNGLPMWIEFMTGIPVCMTSHGRQADDKQFKTTSNGHWNFLLEKLTHESKICT